MTVREQNMEKRRRRILFEARRMLTKDGYDALTTRGLAKAAGVTQPTLYNLIGSKEDILEKLINEAIERIWDRLNRFESSSPLETVEAVAKESIALFREDEAYYRAALIAGDRIHTFVATDTTPRDVTISAESEAVRMASQAAIAAIEAGSLKGRIPAHILGQQMYTCYQGPMRYWAYGHISVDEFETRALRGFYMTLAADAAPEFRSILEAKLLGLVEAEGKNDKRPTPSNASHEGGK